MMRNKGFTLIELMVTLVIIAILAAIALPSYRQSVIKSNRRAAQSAMMDIVNREQQYFVANRAYAPSASAPTQDFCLSVPPEVTANYTCSIVLTAGPPPGFSITLTAIAGQVKDGNLGLTSEGVKTPASKW